MFININKYIEDTVFVLDKGFSRSAIHQFHYEAITILPALTCKKDLTEEKQMVESINNINKINLLHQQQQQQSNDSNNNNPNPNNNNNIIQMNIPPLQNIPDLNIPPEFVSEEIPSLNQNLSRMCTLIRYSIEKIFGTLSRRYKLFSNKIQFHYIHLFGIMLNFACATHCQFGIGKLKSKSIRRKILEFMKIKFLKYPSWHPVSSTFYHDVQKIHKNTSYFIQFNPNVNLLQFQNLLRKYYIELHDLVLFGGGTCNERRSKEYLFASKESIQLFGGINQFANVLYVKYIRRKYKMVHDPKTRQREQFTDLLIVHLNDIQKFDNKLPQSEGGTFEFSENLCRLISFCGNKEKFRTINNCSHATAAMRQVSFLYFC